MAEFALSSEAFAQGGEIPQRHTARTTTSRPRWRGTDARPGTRTLALIVDDPDAPVGTFTHWLAWNIDPSAGGLGEGEQAPRGGAQRLRIGRVERPVPAAGTRTDRSFFRLHAVDELEVGFRTGRPELDRALEGHVLATAELMGTYER